MGAGKPTLLQGKQLARGKQRQHAMMPKLLTGLLIGICLATVCTPKRCLADEPFQAAQKLYAQQDWSGAQMQFLKTLDQANNNVQRPAAQFYAAECALQLKDYKQAETFYQRVIDSTAAADFHKRASFRLAESRQLSGDSQRALTEFRRFVETYPRDELASAARIGMAEILLQMSRYDSALTEFAHLVEYYPGDLGDRARLGMARCLLARKRYDEVPITLGRLCQSKNASLAAESLLLLGRAKYEANQYEQALITFRRVYDLPGTPQIIGKAHLAAGWTLWKLLRLDEVAAEVALLEKNPELVSDYHYLLGMTAYAAKDWATAKNQFGFATQAEGENGSAALFYAGESELLAGNPKSAKASYSKLLELDPKSEWADDAVWGLIKVARAEKSQEEFDQACEQLRTTFPKSDYVNQIPLLATKPGSQVRERDPDLALFEEALGLERDGRLGGAIAAYEEFLAQAKEDKFRAEALWRSARLQGRLKQYAKARQLYTRLLADFPQCDRVPMTLANLARLEEACGNGSEAAKYCRELLEKFPQSSQAVEASYWLAVAAADEKKGDEAQWQVDWLLDRLNPANHSLSESEKQILGQALCLQCQFLSNSNKWQEIVELLESQDYRGVNVAIVARLDFWRAEAALRLNKDSEACERFDQLETQIVGINEPWIPMVALRQAQLATRREDWQDVITLVDELDRQYPEFELAYECDYLRGRALAGVGEMSAARTAYGQVLENDWATGTETAAMAQWMIGESYFHQRNYELARQAYERVIERQHFPEWQARAALQAGKCAELDDDWEAATKYYAEAADRWQETKSAHELNARLRWVQEQVAQKQSTTRR
jgi:TolA-binding protein